MAAAASTVSASGSTRLARERWETYGGTPLKPPGPSEKLDRALFLQKRNRGEKRWSRRCGAASRLCESSGTRKGRWRLHVVHFPPSDGALQHSTGLNRLLTCAVNLGRPPSGRFLADRPSRRRLSSSLVRSSPAFAETFLKKNVSSQTI